MTDVMDNAGNIT